MIETNVLIVGGGPAGSACAWRLRQHNIDCLVLDQQTFPRFKTCAGWITPEVLRDMQIDPAAYPHSFTTFHAFEVAIRGLRFRMRTRQHAIRRIEFDHWLLERSGAPVCQHSVKDIQVEGDAYVIDGQYKAHRLVGAGGTHCPVYRGLFSAAAPRDRGALIVAQEEEFPYPYTDDRCYLWFLENDLPGYAWYVPKANGYLNVGVGGKAEQMKAKGDNLKNHWNYLVEKLDRLGLVRGHAYKPSGHSYQLRRQRGPVQLGSAYLVGDSANLATLDMGEGISAAIRSGLLCADSIATGQPYTLRAIPRYSIFSMLRHGFLF